jgi:hypothetical protein
MVYDSDLTIAILLFSTILTRYRRAGYHRLSMSRSPEYEYVGFGSTPVIEDPEPDFRKGW